MSSNPLNPLLRATALALLLATGCDDDDTPFTPARDAAAMTTDAGVVPDAAPTSPDGARAEAGTTPTAFVDTDIAIVRLTDKGQLDNGFGTNGIAKIDFGAGSSASLRDSIYGIARDEQNRLVLFGTTKGSGRSDLDRVIARVTTEGKLDTTFGAMNSGMQTVNVANLTDNVRHGFVQTDGKIVSAGYTAQPTGVGVQSSNKIVLVRLNTDGSFDNTFGVMGVVNSLPFVPADPANTPWGMAEAYAVGVQGGKYVTTGYGRANAAATDVDVVNFRYDATGKLDTTWGNNGISTLNLIGQNDRGRNLVVLPDNRVLVVGSAMPAANQIDAMALMLTANGTPDTTYDGDGYKLWDLGRPDDAFFGVGRNEQWVAAVGHSAGMVGGVMEDDDATLMLMPITGTGGDMVKATPISMTDNDRFVGVAFGPNGKVYAAGWVSEGGDSRMVVAAFDTTGTLDSSFGSGGIAKINVVAAGSVEVARGIVVQPDGKILIAGDVEKP